MWAMRRNRHVPIERTAVDMARLPALRWHRMEGGRTVRRRGIPGYRQLARRGPFLLEWLGSWDAEAYPLFGAWRHMGGRGATLRFRGWLLLVKW